MPGPVPTFPVTLHFRPSFWCFVTKMKAEKNLEKFAVSIEKWRNGLQLIEDDFKGWYSPSLYQVLVADMRQQLNQLAVEIAKMQPNNTSLQVEKLVMMLEKKWAQKKLRDCHSLRSLPQIAISNNHTLLLTVLFYQLNRDELMHSIIGGGQSLLTYTAQYGSVSVFMWIMQQPKLKASHNFVLCYNLRVAMTHLLETATVGVGLPPGRICILEEILGHRTLDKLPNNALFNVKRTCTLEGCEANENLHCSPLLHLLIEEGAPLFYGGRTLQLCDKRKAMLYKEMNARAIDFRVAVAMGLHNRLGANSLLKTLGSDLVLYIVIAAGIGKSSTVDAKYRWVPRAPLESWRTP
jgi:hypothetical protein